jgi:fatty acid desaturase
MMGSSATEAQQNNTTKDAVKTVTKSQIQKLVASGQHLLIIDNRVYDVKQWIWRHPGGALALQSVVGKNATNLFYATHGASAEKYLPTMFYAMLDNEKSDAHDYTFSKGGLRSAPSSNVEEDFMRLKQELELQELFTPNFGYFLQKFAIYMAMLSAVFAGVTMSDSLFIHMCCAVLLGMFWQQVAFLGHDAGHNGITHNRTIDACIGLIVGNLLAGISMSWWKQNHNIHHIVTNSVENDPDIQHLPFLAINVAFLKERIFSSFYKRYLEVDSVLTKYFCRYQHILYYPIMANARINLYIQSFLLVFQLGHYSKRSNDGEVTMFPQYEVFALAGFWVWLLFLVWQLPTFGRAVLFLMIAHNIAGILHVQITLSHFSMPVHRGVTYDDDKNGFVRTQLDGTLNIDSNLFTDWFHGGLQFQIEHHLFPRIPRHNLRAVKKYVMEFCKRHNLPYRSVSFIEANRMTISTLQKTAMESRGFSQIIWDGVNVVG